MGVGVLTRTQLRGPALRRLYQDVYVPAGLPYTHELRCEAAALVVHGDAVITGRSAATLGGVVLAGAKDPVADLDAVLRAGLVDRMQLRRMLAVRHDRGIVAARRAATVRAALARH
ncbi:MAG TPA: hypothetical protein VF003_13550 [Pseudonocardiaceae bacterium]